MNATTMPESADTPSAKLAFQLYVAIGIAVFLLMMIAGAAFRAAQATWLPIPANLVYEIMTLHGAGMVGVSGLGGAAVMWYFLLALRVLSTGDVPGQCWGCFLVGVVMILAAIGDRQLRRRLDVPLPAARAQHGRLGRDAAAACLVGGLVLIGVGFLLLYLDCALAIMRRYGSLGRALGSTSCSAQHRRHPPPPTVVASTMVIDHQRSRHPRRRGDPDDVARQHLRARASRSTRCCMKNLIFFFGHVFINATIYMAVIGVYEIVPRYTGRPWKSAGRSSPRWAAMMLMVMAVYPHHLLHGLRACPSGRPSLGQVLSYPSGHPGSARDGVRRARQHPSLGLEVGSAAAPDRFVAVRLGGGRHPGDRRRHDPRQPRDAQHAMGARAFPLLSVARPRADAARYDALRVHAQRMERDGVRPRVVLDLRRRRRASSPSCCCSAAGRACRGASPCMTRLGCGSRRSGLWRRSLCSSLPLCSACACFRDCPAASLSA